jgi:hypothetical protein
MLPSGLQGKEETMRSAAQLKQTHRLHKARDIAINAFLIFHLLAISCWCIPFSSPLVLAFRSVVRPYFVWSGLFQSWDMFSPNPKSQNSYLEAVIIYQDGSTQLWSFPRMEFLSLTERYFKERYRKYEESLQHGENADLRPDAARYIARLNSAPSNPVQKVMLVARWSQIIPRTNNAYDRGPWEANVFFTYAVKPEDLK